MKQTADNFQPHIRSFVEAMKVRGYSPATLSSYAESLRAFLAYLGETGVTDPREVTGTIVRNYQLWLQKQEYAPWTILSRLQAVRRFFDHLETIQAVLMNPCVRQPPIKIPERLPKTVLTIEEAQRLLETLDCQNQVGLRDKAILEVFYSTGIRLAEMARLTVGDVDCRNGFLRVTYGKFAKDRMVPLGQSACQWLNRYLDEVRSRWSPPPATQKALWLSSREPHGPLKSQAIEVMVKAHGRSAGFAKRLTPHVWRHTCATHLVARGANVAYVQRILGHSSLRTTQVYIRTSIADVKAMHNQAHPRNQDPVL